MITYKNVMELLVEEEVIRQYKALPARMASYTNRSEWIAYALNQLPPLYATSEKGLRCQIQRGKDKYQAAIRQAVQRALAAIRRDPLRSSVPLRLSQVPGHEILDQLRFLLRNDQLDWEAVPWAVERALEQSSQQQSPPSPSPAPPPHRSAALYRPVQASSPFPTYPSEEARQSPPFRADRSSLPRPQVPTMPPIAPKKPASEEIFGWDDPLYNPR